MRKRKISLVLILAFSLLGLLFIYGGSYLIAQKIEAEVDKLFPELATESRVEGLNFSYKKGLSIENFYLETASEEKKSSATGKDIHASINWMGFLLSGGKLRINSLYMSSLSIRISKSFEVLLDEEVEELINNTVQNMLKRETISSTFSLRIDEFYIVDSNDRVFRIRPIQLSRKGSKELSFFVSEASLDSTTSFEYLRLNIEDYAVSDSLTHFFSHIRKSLVFDSLNPTYLQDNLLKNSPLKKAVREQFQFKKLQISLGIANISKGPIDSLFGFDMHLEKRKESISIKASLKNLYSSLDTLENFLLHSNVSDSLIDLDTFSVLSQKGGAYAFSGTIRGAGKTSSLAVDVNGFKSSLAKVLWSEFPKHIGGKLSFRGRFYGDFFDVNTWNYKGDAFVKDFYMGRVSGVKAVTRYIPFPIRLDSLVLDSMDISLHSGMCNFSASIVDTSILVPFRPYPMLSYVRYDLLKGELEFDTLHRVPLTYKGFSHTISAGNLHVRIDSLLGDTPLLKNIKASSIDLSTSRTLVSLKSKQSPKLITILSALEGINVSKLRIRDKKRRIHPDTLGYYYPTLLTGVGISTEIKGEKGKEQLLLNIDSLVVPKQGRLSKFTAQFDIHNDTFPLYKYSIHEAFIHEKSLPTKLQSSQIPLQKMLTLFPKSKCNIGSFTVQNDSNTVMSVKKMKINYVNDTLYNFSFGTLFKKGKAHLKSGRGRLVKRGKTLAILKGTLQSVTLFSSMDSKKLIKQYSKGRLNRLLKPLLPEKKLSIAHFKIKKRDTVTVKIREMKIDRIDSNLIAVNVLSADFFNRISCKWGAFKLLLGKKGNLLQELDISQLKLDKMPTITLKKKGQSFNKSMIYRFKTGLHLLHTYVDTGASISIKHCAGTVKRKGDFSFKNLKISTGRKKSDFSRFSISRLQYPGFDPVSSFRTKLILKKDRWVVDSMKLVSGDNTRLFASGYLKPIKLVPCSLNVKIENFKLSNIQKHYFKNTDARIRGGAYGQVKLKGNLFDRSSWRAKRASVTLLNTTVENLPLQKGQKITKYAPTFKNIKFSKIIINPVDLGRKGQLHIKYLEAKSDKLNFTGWGSLDFKGRFYFEMKGRVHKEDADALPRLTRLALNEASKTDYGKFYAKLYGDTKKQYLVPERGIAGKIIRSQFRKIGASFRNLFNQKD